MTQPIKGNKETIKTHSKPSHPVRSGSLGGETMADHEHHAKGYGKNQVNEEKSTFGFPIVDPDVTVKMKNIPPLALPHFYVKLHKYP